METAPLEAEPLRLRDGSELIVRSVVPADKPLIAAGFHRLSPESRYRRFFAPLTELSERDLAYLTEIDHHDHEALAALDAEGGQLIGVARYVRGAEPELAEAAVVVADDWHHRGVATALVERLAGRAKDAGITHFVALVMSDNKAAIDLFASLAPGAPVRRSRSGNVELLIELPEPGEMRGSLLARALHQAARGAVTMNPWRVIRETIGSRVRAGAARVRREPRSSR